jgi:hypothetical protein
MPYSRAMSAAVRHLPTASMNRMLACVLVMPSSEVVCCVTMFHMVERTRLIR